MRRDPNNVNNKNLLIASKIPVKGFFTFSITLPVAPLADSNISSLDFFLPFSPAIRPLSPLFLKSSPCFLRIFAICFTVFLITITFFRTSSPPPPFFPNLDLLSSFSSSFPPGRAFCSVPGINPLVGLTFVGGVPVLGFLDLTLFAFIFVFFTLNLCLLSFLFTLLNSSVTASAEPLSTLPPIL